MSLTHKPPTRQIVRPAFINVPLLGELELSAACARCGRRIVPGDFLAHFAQLRAICRCGTETVRVPPAVATNGHSTPPNDLSIPKDLDSRQPAAAMSETVQ
jgi:hypothetical protein